MFHSGERVPPQSVDLSKASSSVEIKTDRPIHVYGIATDAGSGPPEDRTAEHSDSVDSPGVKNPFQHVLRYPEKASKQTPLEEREVAAAQKYSNDGGEIIERLQDERHPPLAFSAGKVLQDCWTEARKSEISDEKKEMIAGLYEEAIFQEWNDRRWEDKMVEIDPFLQQWHKMISEIEESLCDENTSPLYNDDLPAQRRS